MQKAIVKIKVKNLVLTEPEWMILFALCSDGEINQSWRMK